PNVALDRQVLRHEHGAGGRAHACVVADQHVLHAVGQHAVLADAADGGRHAVAVVAVEARLGTKWIVVPLCPLRRGRGQPELARLVAGVAERAADVGDRGGPIQGREHRLGMALHDVHAGAGGADRCRVLGQDLATLRLDLLLLLGDERDEVVEDVTMTPGERPAPESPFIDVTMTEPSPNRSASGLSVITRPVTVQFGIGTTKPRKPRASRCRSISEAWSMFTFGTSRGTSGS